MQMALLFFFICLYLHISRGFYYSSYNLLETWLSGVTIFFLAIATAFLGYVLPWGQISFWGATVITNLLSTIPYIGPLAVQWLWGGFAVDAATLTRFFCISFPSSFSNLRSSIYPYFIFAPNRVEQSFRCQKYVKNPLSPLFHF